MSVGHVLIIGVIAGGAAGALALGIYHRYDRKVQWPAFAVGVLTAVMAFMAAVATNTRHPWLAPFLSVLPILLVAVAWLGRGVFVFLFHVGWLPRYERMPPGPYCKKCGYSLHGLPDPRCPECGERFSEQDGDT